MQPRREARSVGLVATAGLTCLALYAWAVWRAFAPFEDSFITYRYAEHIAQGHGAVWNLGEAPVEGFSSPLWTLLLAGLNALGAELTVTAPRLSIAFGALCVLLMLSLAERLLGAHTEGEPRVRRMIGLALAPALFVIAGPLGYWSGTGMETSMALAVALLAVRLIPLERAELLVRPWRLGCVLALLPLLRPEALVWATVVVGLCIARRHVHVRGFANLVMPLVALYGSWLAFRLSYFGVPAPNTYYAKVGLVLAERMAEGGADVREWSLRYALVLAPLALLLVLRQRRPSGAWLVWPALCQIAAVLYMGGDMFAYHRFLLPAQAICYLVIAQAAWQLLAQRSLVHAIAIPMLLAWVGTAPYRRSPESPIHPSLSPQAFVAIVADMNRHYAEIGRFLGRSLPPGSLIALNAVGIIPYVSKLPTLDLLGLNDAHIARQGHTDARGMRGHRRYDADYALGRRPVAYLPSFPQLARAPSDPQQASASGMLPGDAALFKKPAFAANYVLTHAQVQRAIWLSLYLRRDVASQLRPVAR